MVKLQTWNRHSHDLTTLSGRLNAFVDFCDGYPVRGETRYEQLGEDIERSSHATRKYLQSNLSPRPEVLSKLIEVVLNQINDPDYDPKLIEAWILVGSPSIPCPFEGVKSLKTDPGFGFFDAKRFNEFLDRIKVPKIRREIVFNVATGLDPKLFLDLIQSSLPQTFSQILLYVGLMLRYQADAEKEEVYSFSSEMAFAYCLWIFHRADDPNTPKPLDYPEEMLNALLTEITQRYGYPQMAPNGLSSVHRHHLIREIVGAFEGVDLRELTLDIQANKTIPKLYVEKFKGILAAESEVTATN